MSSLPYPNDDKRNLQIPSPENSNSLPQYQGYPPPQNNHFVAPNVPYQNNAPGMMPAYNQQPQQGYQGYAPQQKDLPVFSPQSQGYQGQPAYPPQPQGYGPPPPGYPPQPQGYGPTSPGYPPQPQGYSPGYSQQPQGPGYPPQPQSYPSSAPQAPGNSSPIPAYSAQPLTSPTMDAIGNLFSEVKLNKGLPTKGQLLAIGKFKEQLCF